MTTVLFATAVIAVIGLIMGLLLITVDRKFKVEVDEKEKAVRDSLPGNNCGACGYAGCDAMAAAIAKGEAPVNGCPVGGDPVANLVAQIMGLDSAASEKKVAYVKCSGTCEQVKQKCNYVGIDDCASAAACGISPWSCDFGCIGLGSCAKACPFGAISLIDGVAVVDRTLCRACGICVSTCPKRLIELLPDKAEYAVGCSNKDKGPKVKKVCTTGCIGCGVCVKQCQNEAIAVDANVAHIDYEKCVGCGKCAEKCPSKVIQKRA